MHVVDRYLVAVHEYRERASQIDLRVQLYDGLGCLERGRRGPKVDGQGINGVDQLVEFQSVCTARVQTIGLADEYPGKNYNDPPIPALVIVGEIGAGTAALMRFAVEIGEPSKACLDIPMAFPEGVQA